ncbi:MAG: DNA methyltransferase [bacterium]|nr:DNA methyltransferase [bacterium]
MNLSNELLITQLQLALREASLHELHTHIQEAILEPILKVSNHPDIKIISKSISQILETKTLDRAHYYTNRLIKSLSEVKTKAYNDINLNRWQEYEHIITDSLWTGMKRDRSSTHHGDYWGNFIPQIPQQMLERYTKKGDWIIDPFLGSGTSLIECKRMGRNGIGIELQDETMALAQKRIEDTENPYDIKTELVLGNSVKTDYRELCDKLGIPSIQMAILHPPYWDIIQFSNRKKDLSNAESIDEYMQKLWKTAWGINQILEPNRHMILVISDKYESGEWIPMGFKAMETILKLPFKLKSIIVKNFEHTKAKREQQSLWRYRALAGGFYVFKHEYIFIFEKIE